jgi:hypothetical protein
MTQGYSGITELLYHLLDCVGMFDFVACNVRMFVVLAKDLVSKLSSNL